MLNLGKKIAELREMREITQEELSKKMGISRSTLSHYEKDRRKPPLDFIVQLAKTFDVSVDQIINSHKVD